ncbi:hypothetical protein [Mesorhizobium sp. LjNodule214]|uniref:hypothetical protein n=1 Tax=Mesorhizobium sp. LjNodule214 TaxID=3342252 RepID=UPI003ECF230D
MTSGKQAISDAVDSAIRKRVRFTVYGPNDLYSWVWSAWAHRNSFYLMPTGLEQAQKVSLHADHKFRLAFDRHDVEYLRSRNSRGFIDERATVVWEKPILPETGAVEVLSLTIPAKHLALGKQVGKPGKGLFAFGITNYEHAAQFHFFMSKEPAASLEPKLSVVGTPTFFFDLDNGENVSMVVREVLFSPPTMTSPHGVPRMDFPADMQDGLTGLHALLHSHPPDGGSLHILEVGGVSLDMNGRRLAISPSGKPD